MSKEHLSCKETQLNRQVAFWKGVPSCFPSIFHSISVRIFSKHSTCIFWNYCHVCLEYNQKSNCLWEDVYFGFLIFCFIAKIVFTCYPLFDWLPAEFQIQSNRWLERGFRNVPRASCNPTCHPDVAVSDRPSKLLQLVFHCKARLVLRSHHSIFHIYQRGVLAIAALCRRSKYIIHSGTDVVKVNLPLMVEHVLKCYRGNMFV